MTTNSTNKSAPAKGMPRHIQEALIRDGVMTEQRVTRTTQRRRCTRCGAWTITAIDDLGILAACDLDRITDYGEYQALTTGKQTWAHQRGGLDWRDPPFIKYRPAREIIVLAEHKCGTALPEYMPQEQSTTHTTDTPPY